MDDPGPTVDVLHKLWLERGPVVVELAVDPGTLRAPQRFDGPVHALDPSFEFTLERLHFLVWANTYDARYGDPVWWHGRRAARLLADEGVVEGGPADIMLADGTPVSVDGGPAGPSPVGSGARVVHRWNVEAGSPRMTGGSMSSADLAPDQRAAVDHAQGAARVIAPAGSGKTRVLTERLRHLVSDRGLSRKTVTALAFNTKAAEQMKERCSDLLTSEGPNIRTLNSIGLWICNRFGPAGRLRVIEEPEVRALLEAVFEIRHQANADTVAPYIDALSVIRLGLTAPAVVEQSISDAAGVAQRFDDYRRALTDAGAVDFDEQIYLAIEILLTDSDARRRAQATCRHLLVDEFQDLNPAHLLLIRLLSAPAYDCFAVGDDDQVIYGYAGAVPEFLIDFPRYFPGATDHHLEVNYRSPPAVVGAARHLLSYNHRRLEKTLRTPEGRVDASWVGPGPLAGRGPVAVLHAPAQGLASVTVQTVTAWRDAGVDVGDIAVLARVNSALLPVQVACAEGGVACTTPLTARVLQRTGIRTAFAYLRIGADPGRIRRQDIAETIRRPSRGIAPMVVEMITKHATTSTAEIRRLAARLSGRDVPKVERYADDIDAVVKACTVSTTEALRTIRAGIGLGDTMDVLDSSRREADRSTHTDDLLALESVAGLHPHAASFEPWLQEVLARPAAAGPAVLLSTVHRVKGREWGHVIVYGASDGLFPHRLSDDEEEERRVFHVAITRARTQVVVLADGDAPSMFVGELDGTRPRPTAGHAGEDRPSRTGSDPRMDRARRNAEQRRRGGPDTPGSSAAVAGRRRADDARRRDKRGPTVPTVSAVEGLVVEDRGNVGAIVEVTATHAVIAVGVARVGVALGSEVSIGGRTVSLIAPEDTGEMTPESEAAEQELRTWRAALARQEGVPAYVILNDHELVGIAVRFPVTLKELATCKGIGQIRLERWGDEILAVLDGVRPTETPRDAPRVVPRQPDGAIGVGRQAD